MIRTVGIVSLSSGILGEPFVQHEVRLGLARLQDYGLQVRFLPHARAGLEALRAHPEWRAEDLLQAFRDPEIDLILCAIGGDDTYRLAPYLFETGKLQRAVTQKPFLGFSDTTIDHFMLRKVGLPTFYGQAFLPDVCELSRTMLPYTRQYFEELLTTGRIRCIRSSDTVYESRKNFGESQLGTPLAAKKLGGFRLLQGSGQFSGEILGGCIDSIFDMFDPSRYADMPEIRAVPGERGMAGQDPAARVERGTDGAREIQKGAGIPEGRRGVRGGQRRAGRAADGRRMAGGI